MVLKSFELHGFKSFPDKTVLPFPSGITAVVGPNGSGKSNVAEAVRWVLGEQNARSLRCEKKMEEIIFHGTAKRGPVGFCEASLILDNSDRTLNYDNDEVVITRRLYRSGESEYYINKTAVRLKDVLDLFLDTGLGRDGYSIIGQGRISEVVSEKSSDRRKIFEEASGIARFRVRKEESERKLKSADENLTRIQDKIDELQLQLDPLTQQAEVAKRYLLARDELRQLEINVWLESLDNLRVSADKARNDFRIAAEQLQQGQESIAALYEQSAAIDGELERTDIQAEALRSQWNDKKEQAAAVETERAVKLTERQHQEQTAQRLREELDSHHSRDAELERQAENERQAIAALEVDIDALRAQETALRAKVAALQESTAGLALELDDARAAETQSRAAAAEVSARLAAEQAATEQWRSQQTAIETAQGENEAVLTQAREELSAHNTSLTELDNQLTAQKNVLQGYELRRTTRTKKLTAQRQEVDSLRLKERELSTRRRTLTAMEREYEGFSNSVKIVMGESKHNRLTGIHGTVNELMSVDDAYATAIEITLGGALQNIVVDTENDAKAAISLLKARNAGRATFLPIAAVRGQELKEPSLQNSSGFVGIASQLVGYDAQYEGIIRQLLGRTVVAEHIDAAIAISRAYRHSFRVVTLDGQIIHAGGSMTGGSIARSTNILSRRNELDRVIQEHTAVQESLTAKEAELAELEREVTAVTYDYDIALEQQRTAETARLQALTASEHAARRVSELENGAVTHIRRLEEIRKAITQSLALQDQFSRAAAEHMQAAEAAKAKQQNHLSGQQTLTGESKTLTEALATLRETLTKTEAQVTSHNKSIADVALLRQSLTGDRDARLSNMAASEATVQQLVAEIAALDERKQAHDADTEALHQALQGCYEQRNALEGKRNGLEKQIREQNEDNLKLEREKSRLELKKEGSEAEEKVILDKLWDNYGLSHTAALLARTPLDSVAKATKRVNALRREIQDMGPVNVGAIEEFDRVKERYDYLSEQQADARAAQKELLTIIGDITSHMREVFETQFTRINEVFGETFTQIFGGGTAHLELEDPDDILNCGVDIKAQPPGKKLKSITLLSGGEKSLVAIALYFSLFKVRPAPFCMLDEIDHELDDVNVARFAVYLAQMAKQTQCVVITHRRGTMEAAGRLYGVTTVEEGVSKIITLTLDEAEGD